MFHQRGHVSPDRACFTREGMFHQIGHVSPERVCFTREGMFHQRGYRMSKKVVLCDSPRNVYTKFTLLDKRPL